ncbi:MAG: thiamine biosynthesis lipoprotein [Candidatus Poriferisodalaceae bacterium]|jgi:thiamine biosynthesis lipoprotein
MSAELRDVAMGCDLRLIVDLDHEDLLVELRILVADLERRWSRFIPDSEVNRLNSANGRPTIVSFETADLVARAWTAHLATAGGFNPLMLAEVQAAGYQQSMLAGSPSDTGRTNLHPRNSRAQPIDGVLADPASGLVQLPAGVGFDPGGIGKGRAADLVAEAAVKAGAEWVIADLGGDVRLAGVCPGGSLGSDGHWIIDVASSTSAASTSASETAAVRIAVDGGGVATSGISKRSWAGGHHLIDPLTGSPASNGIERVTVIASEAWWAEVAATAAAVANPNEGLRLLNSLDLPGRIVLLDGSVYCTPSWGRFVL